MHPALHSLVSKKVHKRIYYPPEYCALNITEKPTAPWENLRKYAGYCERSPLTVGDVLKLKIRDEMIAFKDSFFHWLFEHWQSALVVFLAFLLILWFALPLIAFIRWTLKVTITIVGVLARALMTAVELGLKHIFSVVIFVVKFFLLPLKMAIMHLLGVVKVALAWLRRNWALITRFGKGILSSIRAFVLGAIGAVAGIISRIRKWTLATIRFADIIVLAARTSILTVIDGVQRTIKMVIMLMRRGVLTVYNCVLKVLKMIQITIETIAFIFRTVLIGIISFGYGIIKFVKETMESISWYIRRFLLGIARFMKGTFMFFLRKSLLEPLLFVKEKAVVPLLHAVRRSLGILKEMTLLPVSRCASVIWSICSRIILRIEGTISKCARAIKRVVASLGGSLYIHFIFPNQSIIYMPFYGIQALFERTSARLEKLLEDISSWSVAETKTICFYMAAPALILANGTVEVILYMVVAAGTFSETVLQVVSISGEELSPKLNFRFLMEFFRVVGSLLLRVIISLVGLFGTVHPETKVVATYKEVLMSVTNLPFSEMLGTVSLHVVLSVLERIFGSVLKGRNQELQLSGSQEPPVDLGRVATDFFLGRGKTLRGGLTVHQVLEAMPLNELHDTDFCYLFPIDIIDDLSRGQAVPELAHKTYYQYLTEADLPQYNATLILAVHKGLQYFGIYWNTASTTRQYDLLPIFELEKYHQKSYYEGTGPRARRNRCRINRFIRWLRNQGFVDIADNFVQTVAQNGRFLEQVDSEWIDYNFDWDLREYI